MAALLARGKTRARDGWMGPINLEFRCVLPQSSPAHLSPPIPATRTLAAFSLFEGAITYSAPNERVQSLSGKLIHFASNSLLPVL